MANFFIGGKTTLDANSTGEIRIRIPVSGRVTHIHIYNDGLCEVTNVEVAGKPDIFDGVAVLDQFKERGNIYELKEPLSVENGTDIVFSLKDLSGASNKVYIMLRLEI